MKASFVPGDLHLTQTKDGFHVVSMNGAEIFRSHSEKIAHAKFKQLREDIAAKYPVSELTPKQKAEIFRQAKLDAMLGHNSIGGRKKKTTARGTRTFGG